MFRAKLRVVQQEVAQRSVDLSKLNDYDEPVAELDRMFKFEGELKASSKNWLIVYTDIEGDMMLVGDDPRREFCSMVQKIFIYTREEMEWMNLGTSNPRIEEKPTAYDGKSTAKERKSLCSSLSADLDKFSIFISILGAFLVIFLFWVTF
eukprot:TRINITY_DN33460_c2_g1_i1.p1 TRINITY_DN33460_c2_g1~~TRINITY_DN33460_c2_g1_i1.p1  ORF type:complete len:150 (+),score=25.62 TRINITY_DN33460_c2_g1_i1:95-544(+)